MYRGSPQKSFGITQKEISFLVAECEKKGYKNLAALIDAKGILVKGSYNQFEILVNSKQAKYYNEILQSGLSFTGLKPDLYLLVRNGAIIVDFSYHYFCRVVEEEYNYTLRAVPFSKSMQACIKKIDIEKIIVEVDHEAMTAAILNNENINLNNLAGIMVYARNNLNEKNINEYYTVENIYMSSVTKSSAGLSTEIKLVDSNGSTLSKNSIDATSHKEIEMFKKSALRIFIRNNFRKINIPSFQEDDENGSYDVPYETSNVDLSDDCILMINQIECAENLETLNSLKNSDIFKKIPESELNVCRKKFKQKKDLLKLVEISTKKGGSNEN